MRIKTGVVYKKFACGCIKRAGVESFRIHNPRERTASGNCKKAVVCPSCKTLTAVYQYRFKVCPVCQELRWTRHGNLAAGRCKDCGLEAYHARPVTLRKPKPKKELLFFQHGARIPEPERLYQEVWCVHRRHCLPDEGQLHCGGCAHVMFEPAE